MHPRHTVLLISKTPSFRAEKNVGDYVQRWCLLAGNLFFYCKDEEAVSMDGQLFLCVCVCVCICGACSPNNVPSCLFKELGKRYWAGGSGEMPSGDGPRCWY